MSECGTSGLTKYGDCEEEGVTGWERWATQDELDHYHESGDLPVWETEGRVPVVACAEHAIRPDLAPLTHDATCRQPEGDNGCGACATPVPEPHGGEE